MTRHSRHAVLLAVALFVIAGLTGACMRPAVTLSAVVTPDPNVVTERGLRDIHFGESPGALVDRGALVLDKESCGPRLVGISEASPVFAEKRLVLLWFNPPLMTPEGVQVGTSVAEVQQRYPQAQELRPPEGSYTYPGLLVVRGDFAYLFLHDGQTVRKAIAGDVSYAHKLYETGFGSC